MPVILHDCPHCGARNASFPMSASQVQATNVAHYNMMGACPSCSEPITAVVAMKDRGQDPIHLSGNLAIQRPECSLVAIYPSRRVSKSPESVPVAVARAFIEGAENLKDGRYTSAVAMFRRAIDVGTKLLSDEINAWKLDKRIDALANAGLITKDLQAWAHKIRLEGNDAIHELDEPNKDQAAELERFTELVLTYLYTLPARVKANLPTEKQ